jgi:energy-coupling factor transport system ATP-binding protein
MAQVPPVVALGQALGWEPLPLTVAEAKEMATRPIWSAVGDEAQSVSGAPQLFSVRDLHFAYGAVAALRGVDLDVAEGELVALMGRNGSGKTTLLKCVSGLLRPRRGRIELAGESLVGQETAAICRRVGYLPQEPDALLFADTVAEELEVTLRNHDLSGRPPIPPSALLDRLGISDLATSYPRDLSVGQRQRVALGAVTVTAPRLLLLDEPTRGMDYQAKAELGRLLAEWRAEGSGVVLVTHDVEFVAQVADRVVVLEEGKVIGEGALEKVLASSQSLAPQVSRVFPGTGWLTVEDALAGLDSSPARRSIAG